MRLFHRILSCVNVLRANIAYNSENNSLFVMRYVISTANFEALILLALGQGSSGLSVNRRLSGSCLASPRQAGRTRAFTFLFDSFVPEVKRCRWTK